MKQTANSIFDIAALYSKQLDDALDVLIVEALFEQTRKWNAERSITN